MKIITNPEDLKPEEIVPQCFALVGALIGSVLFLMLLITVLC